ncbi:NUDIX domain-containing protein [Streptomyces sp. NPDC005426]|uniref:NUDIX domain-containing protein n=1 Tax=Streptomyces sp. NPDC005426 TaxID=3155344 RepID=UPI0033AB69F7
MTTTSAPGEPPGSALTDEAYGAQRASAALWSGTSVLITHQFGQVLVQYVDHRDTCLLPGGGLDQGESPARGTARELEEELGVTPVIDRCLAVDWIAVGVVDQGRCRRYPTPAFGRSRGWCRLRRPVAAGGLRTSGQRLAAWREMRAGYRGKVHGRPCLHLTRNAKRR